MKGELNKIWPFKQQWMHQFQIVNGICWCNHFCYWVCYKYLKGLQYKNLLWQLHKIPKLCNFAEYVSILLKDLLNFYKGHRRNYYISYKYLYRVIFLLWLLHVPFSLYIIKMWCYIFRLYDSCAFIPLQNKGFHWYNKIINISISEAWEMVQRLWVCTTLRTDPREAHSAHMAAHDLQFNFQVISCSLLATAGTKSTHTYM